MDDDMLMDGLMERIAFELGGGDMKYSKHIDPVTLAVVHRFAIDGNDNDDVVFLELDGETVDDLVGWYCHGDCGRLAMKRYFNLVKGKLEDCLRFEMKIKRDSRHKLCKNE